MLFPVYVAAIFLLLSSNRKNDRLKASFYCVIISLKQLCIETKLYSFKMSIRCCKDISNIPNSLWENEEDIHVCGKEDDTVDIFSVV